ncbi:MAG: hypothetical protein HY057_05025 [Rhodospirillales bacterium]|nr:hypothetical protein [Rhodospirillales bacterium]
MDQRARIGMMSKPQGRRICWVVRLAALLALAPALGGCLTGNYPNGGYRSVVYYGNPPPIWRTEPAYPFYDGYGYYGPPHYRAYPPAYRDSWPWRNYWAPGYSPHRSYYGAPYNGAYRDPCLRVERGAPVIRELGWRRQRIERVC